MFLYDTMDRTGCASTALHYNAHIGPWGNGDFDEDWEDQSGQHFLSLSLSLSLSLCVCVCVCVYVRNLTNGRSAHDVEWCIRCFALPERLRVPTPLHVSINMWPLILAGILLKWHH